MRIVYDVGPDELYVPAHGLTLRRGEPTEVPDHVAGREPGDPEPISEADVDLDDGRLYARAEDGTWTVADPGAGLLAQSTFRVHRTEPTAPGFTARVSLAAGAAEKGE